GSRLSEILTHVERSDGLGPTVQEVANAYAAGRDAEEGIAEGGHGRQDGAQVSEGAEAAEYAPAGSRLAHARGRVCGGLGRASREAEVQARAGGKDALRRLAAPVSGSFC